jgi:MraZ protein
LDDKGRLTLPSKFREQLQPGLVMAYWLGSCIGIFPRDEFERLGEKLASLPASSKEVRSMQRVLFSKSQEAIPDRQGRINIPAGLRQMAGLDREVVVVGLRKYIEVWDKEKWAQAIEEGAELYDKNAESLSDLGF